MATPLPATRQSGFAHRDVWQPIQDGLARLSGLRIVLLGASGEAWSTPSGVLAPAVERIEARGEASRERALLAARVRGEPITYLASTGLQAFVVPVDTPQGRVFLAGGHAFPAPPDEGHRQRLARDLGLDADGLDALLQSLPVLAPAAFRALVQTLDRVARSVLGGLGEADRARRQVDRASTLFALAPDLVDTGATADGEQLALQAIGVLFDVPAAAILTREPGADTYRAAAAFGAPGLDLAGLVVRPGGAGAFGRALAAPEGPAQPIETRDVYEILKSGFPGEVQSVHAFPMADGHGSLLVLVNADLGRADVDLVAAFARQAGVALETRRLRLEVARRERDLAALAEAGGAVSSALDSTELFRMILESAAAMVGANLGSLMLLDEARGELAIKATKGLHERIVEQFRIRPGEGIAGMVAATREAMLVRDVETDARVGRRNRPRFKSRSFVSLPLLVKGRAIGVLNLADKAGGEPFDETDLTLLSAAAAQAAIAIERSAFYERSEALKRISITDGLTGLLNRHYFEERLTEEIDRATRTKSHVSLVMIDIDGFKAFNDTHGHVEGDQALRLTAASIRGAVRTMDIVARYGGEEFAVILPETGRAEAIAIAERIVREVEALTHIVEGESIRLTISAGVAEFPDDASSLRELIVRADKALYAAKAAGKNRIGVPPSR
ncbi:MAG TPA: diguanylate cyclase [Thermodesulfobacteriota bacterium]